MTSLTNEQRQLLFDYTLGSTSAQETAEAKALISSNAEAAELHSKLKAIFAPLDTIEFDACPDELADRTILRLRQLADSAHDHLEQLLAVEQTHGATIKFGFWRNFSEVITVAAVLMLIAAVSIPSLGLAREKYRQHRCQMQLGNIFQGFSNYIADHDGELPAVAREEGSPWWKVGYQGSENHSNTRPVWLLVKNGYVKPANFVCPGRPEKKKLRLANLQVQQYNDFPGRAYVSFSFRIRCRKVHGSALRGRKVLMADLNPLSERMPRDYSQPFRVRLSEELLRSNSINHNRKGQNVMFCDGSVEFEKTRHAGLSDDDMFTLQEMCSGSEVNGCEIPSCETDAFLAP
jgi:prepilin-type processing-associated H-X9-DG protein